MAIKGELDDEAFTLLDECHLLDNALDHAHAGDFTLSDGVADLAADRDAMEVVPEVLTREVDLAFTLTRPVGRCHVVEADLGVVVELSEGLEFMIEVDTKVDTSRLERVLGGQAHGALNYRI